MSHKHELLDLWTIFHRTKGTLFMWKYGLKLFRLQALQKEIKHASLTRCNFASASCILLGETSQKPLVKADQGQKKSVEERRLFN